MKEEQIVRWGILGTGNIANEFAKGLYLLPNAMLQAVGSRRQESADAFARMYSIPHAHDSYEALAADPTVDIVYVATPHVYHKENSLLCLNGGKSVLCEKPFTINQAQAEAVFATARVKQKFVMEAVWTRFLPHMTKLFELIGSGAIGTVEMVQANFGYQGAFDPESRIFDPNLAGGALLDVGIYPIYLAYWLLGMPQTIHSAAHIGETGVDERAGIIFSYDNGAMAVLSTANRNKLPDTGVISGSQGRIILHERWWAPDGSITLYGDGEPPEHFNPLAGPNGYSFEAQAAMDALTDNALEHPLVRWQDTLNVQQIMDTIRAQWGLVYPQEENA